MAAGSSAPFVDYSTADEARSGYSGYLHICDQLEQFPVAPDRFGHAQCQDSAAGPGVVSGAICHAYALAPDYGGVDFCCYPCADRFRRRTEILRPRHRDDWYKRRWLGTKLCVLVSESDSLIMKGHSNDSQTRTTCHCSGTALLRFRCVCPRRHDRLDLRHGRWRPVGNLQLHRLGRSRRGR